MAAYTADVRVFDGSHIDPAIISSYQEFADRENVVGSPFCDLRFILAFARVFDQERLVLVSIYQDSRIIAMPVFLVGARKIPIRLAMRTLCSSTAVVLRLPDSQFLREDASDWSAILKFAVDTVEKTIPFDLAWVENSPCHAFRFQPNDGWRMRNVQATFMLKLPPTYEEFWAGLSSRLRNNHTRPTKKLQEASNRSLRWVKYSSSETSQDLAETAHSVWLRSWHGKTNTTPTPGVKAIASIADEGWLRSYVLYVGEKGAAYIVGYQYKGIYYYENIGFDEEWRDSSPGIVANYYLLKDLFCESPPRSIDFGFGYNKYKEALGNVHEERGELWKAISARGRWTMKIQAWVADIGLLLKWLVKRMGFYDWIRRRLRKST